MNYIKIKTEPYPDSEYGRVPYFETDDGWKVDTRQVDENDEWRIYAHEDAREMDLRQLLKKEYDVRY